MFGRSTPPSFPIWTVALSLLLLTCAAVLLRRRFRRVGDAPHCIHCNYLLVGIQSERCPECGKPIRSVVTGERRYSHLRLAIGLACAVIAPLICWKPLSRWASVVYWYPYRPTFLVIDDLESGRGLPAPRGSPLDREIWLSHGWLSEQVDLSRVAMDELHRRDKLNQLSVAQRHKIDEIALASLARPMTTAGDCYLNDELSGRLAAKKLTSQEEHAVYSRAVTLSLTARPQVMQWEPVRIQLQAKTRLPRSLENGWAAEIKYLGVSIDGEPVQWAKNRPDGWAQYNFGLQLSDFTNRPAVDNFITYSKLGRHRVDLDVVIKLHYGSRGEPEKGDVLYTEQRRLSAALEELPPSSAIKALRFACDPSHEFGHYLSLHALHAGIENGNTFMREFGIVELLRRDAIGTLEDAERQYLTDQILRVQRDYFALWDTSFGDWIEQQKATGKLAPEAWQSYADNQMHAYLRTRPRIPVGQAVPLDIVNVPRRGNSQVSAFSIGERTYEVSVSPNAKKLTLEKLNLVDNPSLPSDFHQFSDRYLMHLDPAPPGRYTVRGKVKDCDLQHTDRPLGMQMPTTYRADDAAFDIVPLGEALLQGTHETKLRDAVHRSVVVSDLLRWSDGALTFHVIIDRPPVDLAFHGSLVAGTQEWKLGDLFCRKDEQTHYTEGDFNVPDSIGKSLPTNGLALKCTADRAIAERCAGGGLFWDEDVVTSGLKIDRDEFSKPH